MAANFITVSRIFLSLALLFFTPESSLFAIFYLLCGLTDVLDGFTARKLHTESEKGAVLDSTADMVFAAVYALKILPLLSVPLAILIWTAIIAIFKFAGILLVFKRKHRLRMEHSFGNKLTGCLLFLLPMSVCIADVKYGACIVCIAASINVVKEIKKSLTE